MRKFIRDIWYGEPVRVFAILAAVGTALVAFTDLPPIIDGLIVAIEGIGGAYGTRRLTTPERLEKLSGMRDELDPPEIVG